MTRYVATWGWGVVAGAVLTHACRGFIPPNLTGRAIDAGLGAVGRVVDAYTERRWGR